MFYNLGKKLPETFSVEDVGLQAIFGNLLPTSGPCKKYVEKLVKCMYFFDFSILKGKFFFHTTSRDEK